MFNAFAVSYWWVWLLAALMLGGLLTLRGVIRVSLGKNRSDRLANFACFLLLLAAVYLLVQAVLSIHAITALQSGIFVW